MVLVVGGSKGRGLVVLIVIMVNYTLYTYKFICNTPLDNQFSTFSIGMLLIVFFRKGKFLSLVS